jgi:hypothetical protein
MHKYLILDASRRERGELRPFVGRERFDRLDQSDRSDRDQIFEIFAGIVELLDIVNTKRCKSFGSVIGNLELTSYQKLFVT